ncbi:SDR family oxidoreductase [uncultured Metabacillus sp.]|uniref:SDR family NAD(P)-dependent oxidoreductase n=1 Tax=uncultured Metabacillus sp. TaxID=2860135 RepID=UPI0026369D6E|nr:SDR family oxidoreductase [uncultured Metabacillus sp.]
MKNVLVIGGAAGIGKDIALSFVMEGNTVAIADINKQALTKMKNEYGKENKLFVFEADASEWKSIEDLAKQVKEQIGTIDLLVYSAGITKRIKFEEIDWETWKKTMAVNLHGLFYSIKSFYPFLEFGGSVVIIGSGSAITGSGGGIHYASSKGGAFGFMRSLVTDLGKLGITINVLAPRVIESEMLDALYPSHEAKQQLTNEIPIGRLGKPSDITSAVKYLCSDQAKYIHGQVILLDGGRTYKSS